MRSEVVHDDDVAGMQGRDKHLIDVEAEAFAIDRAIDEPGCLDAIVTEGGEEGHGGPSTVWHLARQALTLGPPASQRRHIGLGPSLVDEDQAGRIDAILIGHPLLTPSRHVGTVALAGDQRLFL